jgi:hypothetical protein
VNHPKVKSYKLDEAYQAFLDQPSAHPL